MARAGVACAGWLRDEESRRAEAPRAALARPAARPREPVMDLPMRVSIGLAPYGLAALLVALSLLAATGASPPA